MKKQTQGLLTIEKFMVKFDVEKINASNPDLFTTGG
jgi:hypothetical protein